MKRNQRAEENFRMRRSFMRPPNPAVKRTASGGRLPKRWAAKMKLLQALVALLVGSVVQPTLANAQSQQESLFQRIVEGTKCEQVPNNGRYCKYELSGVVSVSIKDVGGADTVVGFHNSNIKNEFYAVMYFGCVGIVPGEAHLNNYDRNLGVFISPRTGKLHRTHQECKATLK